MDITGVSKQRILNPLGVVEQVRAVSDDQGDGEQPSAKQASVMPRWRRRLFVAFTALTADAAVYFNFPRDRTVIIGSRIPL